MKKTLVILCGVMLAFALVRTATADTIKCTLEEYSSCDTPDYLVGTFSYDLTWQAIISATISGEWGNSDSDTTADNILFVDDLEIGDTTSYNPSPTSNKVFWSYDFNVEEFSILEDGEAHLFAVQTSTGGCVRLGETTLTIDTAPIPEPGTMLLVASGLLAFVGFRKRI